MAKYPFTDLHSFKDYVGFVKLCAPDLFPVREGAAANEPWTLDRAFEGLRFGIELVRQEKGNMPALQVCMKIFEEAYREYANGHFRNGFKKLEESQKVLSRIPSQ